MWPKLVLGLLLLLGTCQGIFEDCDFYEELKPDKSYYLFSPEYPYNYPPGTSCRWYVVSPPKTRIRLVCKEFRIPVSQECQLDGLGISRGGHIDLRDVQYFCGSGELDVISDKNRLNIVLLTVNHSPGGDFFCHFEVKEENPPPEPPPEQNCICGLLNIMRVVGGTETGVNEYPMMAGLIDGKTKEFFCGATIISRKFVLTAAHCLFDKNERNIGVLVGDHDVSVGNDTDSSKLYLSKKVYIHPEFNPVNQKNDVALIRVRKEIEFGREVGAACLPFLNTNDSFAGETVQVLGWGKTDFGGPASDKLLKAPLNVITMAQCKPAYGDLVSEKQMCTYEDGKDGCLGDSGGPLLWTDPTSQLVKVVGVVSYGIQCATSKPGVNTRVTSYLDWIKKTTREDFCVV